MCKCTHCALYASLGQHTSLHKTQKKLNSKIFSLKKWGSILSLSHYECILSVAGFLLNNNAGSIGTFFLVYGDNSGLECLIFLLTRKFFFNCTINRNYLPQNLLDIAGVHLYCISLGFSKWFLKCNHKEAYFFKSFNVKSGNNWVTTTS